MNKATFAEVG